MTRQAFLTHRAGHLALLAAIILTINCGDNPTPVGVFDPRRAVARVEVTPSEVVLAEGREQRLTAQPYNAEGLPLPGRLIRWSSSNTAVVTFIQANGTAVAVGAGTATIFAECEGVRGTATATITRAVVFSVEVRPGAVEAAPGDEVEYVAVPYDDIGRPLTGRVASWETGDPNVASVTTGGLVTGRAFGSTVIGATIEGVLGRGVIYLLPAPTNVTAIDLGTIDGVHSVALAINRHGIVVGQSQFANGLPPRAFRWSSAGGMTDLGTLGGPFSIASGVNDDGQIVGTTAINSGQQRAFRWTLAGGMQELAVGVPGTSAGATSINAAGDIVGAMFTVPQRAFLLKASGELHMIAPLSGFAHSSSNAVNAQGTVVGISFNDFYYYYYGPETARGFRWSGGTVQELGLDTFHASDVNDGGVIVGMTSASHPFRWTPGSPATVLSTLGSESLGAANSINELGVVAGRVTGAAPHAVIWLPSGERMLLSSEPSEAMAISETGWVVGWRSVLGGAARATLWKIAGVSQP